MRRLNSLGGLSVRNWLTFAFLVCLGATGTVAESSAERATPGSARPVPREYFGMHIHRADSGTPWPAAHFGSWRLWDANVGWPELEPARGEWNFKQLDRY